MFDVLDPTRVERSAYGKVLSDGIIDLFVGLSLVWVGSAWLWLDTVAGIAGVIPAVLVVAVLELRKRVMEPRTGYVRFGAARRSFERRSLAALVLLGIGMHLAGVAGFVLVATGVGESSLEWIMPGLLAWLLAFASLMVALMFEVRRFVLYAGVLAIAGLVAAVEKAQPGLPLLIGGCAIGIAGAVTLLIYLHRNPVVRQP